MIARVHYVLSVPEHIKELFNLPPLVLKARHLSGSAFCWVRFA